MTKKRGRVVGLDVHPDSFAGAVVEGSDAANAQVLSTSTRVELEPLEQWALRHTRDEDTLVLEASGNAFVVAARLRLIGRKGGDPGQSSCGQGGQSLLCQRSSGCSEDRAHLFECALAHRVAARSGHSGAARDLQCVSGGGEGIDSGQATAALHVERTLCASGEGLSSLSSQSHHALAYTPIMDAGSERCCCNSYMAALVAARARRTLLRRHMAQEIVAEEALLRLTRLCGINLVTLYGVVAAVGDVRRFPHSKKLVHILVSTPVSPKAATSKEAEHSSGMEEERCAPCSSNRARSCWK